MNSCLKEIYEINKTKTNSQFLKKLHEALDKLIICDERLNSVMIFVLYGGYEENKEIAYHSNGKFKVSFSQENELLKFKVALGFVVTNFIRSKIVNANILVAYNFEKSEFLKIFLNLDSDGNILKSESAKTLNVEPTDPRFSLSQMVLNENVKTDLLKLKTLIENTSLIFDEWGFRQVDSTPRCVVNFYGPPGTGKTMAAHAIASEIHKKILPLNYSDIESKFVGDAPKNLVAAFAIARENDCVLFFDEADSFLGKRISNVTSSSDQSVNSLRSQMLILLESFEGIVIFATNLIENYDNAFESRILQSVKFELPNEKLREEIIRKMIPKKAPVDKEVFNAEFIEKLSKIIDGFSPREIKNAVLQVLVRAVYEKVPSISCDLFDSVFSQEAKRKNDLAVKEPPRVNLQNEDKNNVEEKVKEGIEKGEYVAYRAEDLLKG